MKKASPAVPRELLALWVAFLCGFTPLAHAQQSWDGSYVGLTAASSRNVINGTTVIANTGGDVADEAANNLRNERHGAGLVLGFRRQLDSGLIVGIEADLTRVGHRASNQDLIGAGTYAGQPSDALRYEMPWLATSRAVAAWSFGDWLLFGSGGAAFATEKVTRTQYRAVAGTSQTATQFSEIDRVNRLGYALGAGLEWRWGKPWSIRAEYLHVRFPKEAFRFPDARGGAQAAYSSVQGRIASNEAKLNALKIGLIYRFGSGL